MIKKEVPQEDHDNNVVKDKANDDFLHLKAEAISESAEIIDNSDLSDGGASSSDSDFDMFEALEKSKELQELIRENIRNELEVIGPQIFERVKQEFKRTGLSNEANDGGSIPFKVVSYEDNLKLRDSWGADLNEEKKNGEGLPAQALSESMR